MSTGCIWQSILSNQDHFWYALAGIGSFGTLFVALRALKTWRDEKEYDLAIENLTLCNVAVQFIQMLRSPIIFEGEINERYKEKASVAENDTKALSSARETMFIYQSRKDNHQVIYEQVLKMREKNWAVYGARHDFYKFYNRIVELDDEIRQACIRQYYAIEDREKHGDVVQTTIILEARKKIYAIANDKDEINLELASWIEKLQTHRKTKP